MLRVPFLLLDQTCVETRAVAADAPVLPTDVWEAHCVGMEEGATQPPPVLCHLLGLLVVELRHDGSAETSRHVKANLVHAPLCDLTRTERIIHGFPVLLPRVVSQHFHMRPRPLSVGMQPRFLAHGLDLAIDRLQIGRAHV